MKEKISQQYSEWVNEHKTTPLYAQSIIEFVDDNTRLDVTIKLTLDIVEEEDDEIFYYCNHLEDFLSLCDEGSGDFKLIGVDSFQTSLVSMI